MPGKEHMLAAYICMYIFNQVTVLVCVHVPLTGPGLFMSSFYAQYMYVRDPEFDCLLHNPHLILLGKCLPPRQCVFAHASRHNIFLVFSLYFGSACSNDNHQDIEL